MSDNIKVVVKVRPLIPRELEDKLSFQWRVKNNTLHQLDQNGREFGSCFTFDQVYDTEAKTCDIYNDIAKPIVEAATAGFNGTIFAYGQTSSGKTYTMTGTEQSPGIIPLAVCNLFTIIKNIPDRDFLVRVSYIEIYNETIKDLLNEKKIIKVHETLQGVKVDCTEQVTTTPEEVLKYLKEGEANRQTGATNMNEESSRSHSIFQITIESRDHIEGEAEVGCVNVSQLNLVDLAGSERAGQTGATGLRFKEGTHINKSLSALALVIKQLSEDQTKHVNYRDSKLTRILQNSLGGNAKTSIICAITPAAVEETISTLQFANRAKSIKNKPEVNAVATDATMIQSLTKQLSKLQSQLESKKNLEVMLESKKNVEYNLQKQIAALQRLILNGFGQRSTIDMMAGTRRKPVPLRRITISTLHSIDEDPVPSVPKFHTPLLKYNTMMFPGPGTTTDFVPIQNERKISSLSCLPEENDNRLITPPPHDKKVNFNDEIIELDSDDDISNLDDQTCSPYHHCYGKSKTPPCVLRKNAKMAEKSLKDIVELTEREKIYTPSVVELIEKLEQNNSVIARLEDEVQVLNKKSKEKDLEIDQLKVKVSRSNEAVETVNSAKAELEALCKEYTTKLTDWEVSFDTLKAKSKRREDELLTLIGEQKVHKKHDDNSKLLGRNLEKELNFMDMSKDISLVNSDNESSITNLTTNDDETTSQVQDLVKEMQNQISSKNQAVLKLEADILSQKQEILSLESSSRELQKNIEDFKEKVDLLENENVCLKKTVDTLNSTIKCQKATIESANNDIESYNSLIQELQIKLTNKDKIPKINITENSLEKMIANEENFIANNENMKNIIHSFKLALETRNKEIECLKSTVAKNSTLTENYTTLQDQLKLKEIEFEKINEKAIYLQDQINENITVINNLMKEKTNFSIIEQQLTSKLSEITDQNNLLEKSNNEKTLYAEKCKESYDELLSTLTEQKTIEKELQSKHETLEKKIEDLKSINLELQQDIEKKDLHIASLKISDLHSQQYLSYANLTLQSLQNIIAKLTGSTSEVCDEVDNVTNVFDKIKDDLAVLDTALTKIMSQKSSELENSVASRNSLQALNITLEREVAKLKDNIDCLAKENQKYQIIKDDLTQQITLITNERDNISNELKKKTKEITDLEINLNDYREQNERLQKDLLTKENIISNLTEKEKYYVSKMETLELEKEQQYQNFTENIKNLENNLETKENDSHKLLQEKETLLGELNETIKKMEQILEEKSLSIDNLNYIINEEIDLRTKQLHSILELALKVTAAYNIAFENEENSMFDNIIIALNQLVNHSMQINNTTSDTNHNVNDMLETINSLTEEKDKISENLSQMDITNQSLRSQINEIQLESKLLNDDLFKGNEIIDSLKKELNTKANEIENMVTKTQELKDHFSGLQQIMKQQIKDLQVDNDQLTVKCSELEIYLNNNAKTIEIQNLDNDEEFDDNITRKSMSNTIQTVENIGPPSLLTICCNKIVESIQPNAKTLSPSDSNTSIEYHHKETQSVSCECHTLLPELKSAQIENVRLTKVVEQLEVLNQRLILEHEEVRREVELLAEPALELQKKIASHKTNLSTLTATTYAENKSLTSQVKVLQHHQSRFHNVCQRDLPVVKKQLHDLLTILKCDSSHIDKHNASFKRYSLPIILDNNGTLNIKNESTLDGDLLMLDTNITLTTSADNTLMGLDQTCFDLTQPCSNNDVGCQTDNPTKVDSTDVENNLEITKKIQSLEIENRDLKQQINDYSLMKVSIKDAQSSPIKIKDLSIDDSRKCEKCKEVKVKYQSLEEELKLLAQKLLDVEAQRIDFEKKYNNLALEIPSTDALVKKLSIFQKELNGKVQEISKLKNLLSSKHEELKHLQDENDALSNQVMENISETDDLNKELEKVKDANEKLTEKCNDLEKILNETKTDKIPLNCSQCQIKDDVIHSLQNVEIHSKFNRSLSDSDTSSRYNKICTLQNELHAGREDCKELTEEVATIKNHLERSNLSMGQNMDLDDSMGESNIFTITKHFDAGETQINKLKTPNANLERQEDIYSNEKLDCITYYVEKTGADKENLDCNVRIIDVMKMFYNNFVMKHNNEVENLVNKIKCYEESKIQLENHVSQLSNEYSKLTVKLEEKENNIQKVNNTFSQIRQNISTIHEEIMNLSDSDKNIKLVAVFKEKLLNIVDNNFELSFVNIFEMVIDNLVSKHQKDLSSIMDQYTKLQQHMESVTIELSSVSNNLLQMKSQLTEKENEYNLLKAQKERIHEISSAVTLDLVRKEQELCQTIVSGCKKLVEHNILRLNDIDKTLPLHENLNILFNCLITELRNQSDIEMEKEKLNLEIKTSKTELEETQKVLDTLKIENDTLKEEIQRSMSNLDEKDKKLESQNSAYIELDKKYQTMVEENNTHLNTINTISLEMKTLKETLLEKEAALKAVSNETDKPKQSDKEAEIVELYNTIACYKQELDDLMSINKMIITDKESSALELEKTKELLKTNNMELDKMTSDILILKESVKDNKTIIDNLKLEAKSLLQQNIELKQQFEEKCRACSRLEMNIKTHEKTAEIQSRMIIRLQKQKEEDDREIAENKKRCEEVTQRYTDLLKDCEIMKNNIKTHKEELDTMKSAKEVLETRLSEIEMNSENGNKPRVSIDATSHSARHRRQSIYDSKRIFSEKEDIGDHNKMEAVFESRAKPADLFMDVDDDSSNRSSPLHRNSKGRDSISKHDQSDEPVSRPSSVAETRRRRQSIHDMHRSVCQTPSPNGRPSSRLSETRNTKSTDVENNYVQSEVAELRDRLSSCQQELEELKEQYRELDEECDTCAQYLRERDDQCARLKKEKAALEGLVTELKDKLQSINPNRSQQEQKPSYCHAAVNTDEDWANLHSVVVDRMSFDAEVEKNKRLTKTIEDLRFKKQDLKLTLAKMQKALEKNANKDHSKELELVKAELKACRLELKELKERYKELDEECETCARYLRERDDQCRKLKEAKAALEAKLQEYTEDSGNISQSLRRKRHSALDQRRAAATQVADDFLNNQVERDDNSRITNDDKSKELKHLKMAVERLSLQKASLEQQLASSAAAAPVYVATGSAIVQTQQLSDVMKENQKLKKINSKLIEICKKRGKKPDSILDE